MKEEMKKLIQFLKKPTVGFETEERGKRFLKVVAFDLIFAFVALGAMALLDQIDVIHKNLVHKSSEINGIVLLISAVIFAPILEEFVFRYFLVDNKINPLKIIVRKKKETNSEFKYKEDEEIQNNRWNRILPIIFYVSTSIFALVHIFNYQINTVSLMLMPLLLSTPFVLGALAGYLRVRVNFGAAVGLHFIHNIIFVSIGVLSGEFYAEKDYNEIANIVQQITKDGVTLKERIITTGEYSLEIRIDRKYDGTTNESRIIYDSVLCSPTYYKTENYRMKDIYRDMKKFYRDSLLFTNPSFLAEYDGDLRVDINFNRRNNNKIHSLDSVLKGIKETMSIKKE